jgi:hypothetical protein
MAGRVGNPASPVASGLKPLGAAKYIVAGDYVVTPPAGARWLRMELRGGGGAGGIHNGAGASGGGEGAVQRRILRIRAGDIALTVGAGGSNGGANKPPARSSGASAMLGYVALPGAAGQSSAGGTAAGGAGDDGVDPLVGYGSFSGAAGQSIVGGGAYGRSAAAPEPGRFGSGGYGQYSNLEAGPGGPGGDGYAFLEFFG